jgi:hypothetical protein
VDEFVLSMNRAAEKGAPGAKDIFWVAIKEMSFDDARQILSGGDTAATEYLRAKTSEKLTAAFRPVVTDSMKDVGVIQQYKELLSSYQSVPLASSLPSVDIESYVVSKALDGLFLVRQVIRNPDRQGGHGALRAPRKGSRRRQRSSRRWTSPPATTRSTYGVLLQ